MLIASCLSSMAKVVVSNDQEGVYCAFVDVRIVSYCETQVVANVDLRLS